MKIKWVIVCLCFSCALLFAAQTGSVPALKPDGDRDGFVMKFTQGKNKVQI